MLLKTYLIALRCTLDDLYFTMGVQTCHMIRVTRIRYVFFAFFKVIRPYSIFIWNSMYSSAAFLTWGVHWHACFQFVVFLYDGGSQKTNTPVMTEKKLKHCLVVLYEGSTPSRGKPYNLRWKVGKSPRSPARKCTCEFGRKLIIYFSPRRGDVWVDWPFKYNHLISCSLDLC